MRSCAEPWEIAKKQVLCGGGQVEGAGETINTRPQTVCYRDEHRVSIRLGFWYFGNEQT